MKRISPLFVVAHQITRTSYWVQEDKTVTNTPTVHDCLYSCQERPECRHFNYLQWFNLKERFRKCKIEVLHTQQQGVEL
ncbi:PAN domain-containing protein [Pseudothermotoga sp. U03pept]|uniref:PAN domain-containing protein n=1 Tax=Pseudothermotoga sp. U03pept TaxID=3447012 RepID=UPI003F06B61A